MNRSIALRRSGLVVLALAIASASVGCTSSEVEPPAPTATSTPSAAPEAAPAPPTLQTAGTAADNLPFFTSVVQTVAAGPEAVVGRAYIDALAAAGFDKAAMQVTEDTTTVGNPAESIQFSVRWADACLLGQVGPATGAPVTTVMAPLAAGNCLIGQTRPIDW